VQIDPQFLAWSACGGAQRQMPARRWRGVSRIGRALLLLSTALAGAVAAGCGGSSGVGSRAADISKLKTISTLSTTVDPQNGDNNPYGLAIAPTGFTGDGNPAHIQPGDLVVSNFSNAGGNQWQGTTVEAIRNGAPVRVYSEVNAPTATGGTVSTTGPVALAFSPNGNLWVANFGPANDGSTGNVQWVKFSGTVMTTLNDPKVVAGWGQAFNGGFGGQNAFFTVNILTGKVVRINIVSGTSISFTYTELTPDLGHAATSVGGTPYGPAGMVHAADDTLYVANGFNNTIIAIPNSSTVTTPTTGRTVYHGTPLNQPIMMTQNPINGDLIVANQLDNNLVEITTGGQLVATKTVDPAIVDPSTGANSGLFGVVATKDSAGNLLVYFTDDNDNTVKKLSL
jgi:hypothetical protein